MYQLVLFDLDGTLINTIPLIISCFEHTYSALGMPIPTVDQIKEGIGIPLAKHIKDKMPSEIQPAFLNIFRDYTNEHLTTHVSIFTPVWSILNHITSLQVPMGIMTAKRRGATMVSVDQFDLTPFFQVIQTAEDTAYHKPDPRSIWNAVTAAENILQNSIDPKRVLYVGDNTMDVAAANDAGCDCAIVGWTQMEHEKLMKSGDFFWLRNSADLDARINHLFG
ncbi:MAG TPA: HAD family hydrolase [Clostridiaceae bacterium]|nr:HAD family hydrolase [Clostridiaceae bacterium]